MVSRFSIRSVLNQCKVCSAGKTESAKCIEFISEEDAFERVRKFCYLLMGDMISANGGPEMPQ